MRAFVNLRDVVDNNIIVGFVLDFAHFGDNGSWLEYFGLRMGSGSGVFDGATRNQQVVLSDNESGSTVVTLNGMTSIISKGDIGICTVFRRSISGYTRDVLNWEVFEVYH